MTHIITTAGTELGDILSSMCNPEQMPKPSGQSVVMVEGGDRLDSASALKSGTWAERIMSVVVPGVEFSATQCVNALGLGPERRGSILLALGRLARQGKLYRPMVGVYRLAEDGDTREPHELRGVGADIAAILPDGEFDLKWLREQLPNHTAESIKHAMSSMRDRGEVRRVGRGVYKVVSSLGHGGKDEGQA